MDFPTHYEVWHLSSGGQIVVAMLAVAGAVLAGVVARRSPGAMRSRVPLTLFGLAVVVHALTVWILIVDPFRNSGDIPLPWLAAVFAAYAGIFLFFAAPFLGAYVVVRALLALPHWRRRPAYLAFVLMAVYANLIAPWGATIMAD
ncbi:MAG TPA: hypothetical protein VGD79_07795 [Thermoanaerobaculia bacterium]